MFDNYIKYLPINTPWNELNDQEIIKIEKELLRTCPPASRFSSPYTLEEYNRKDIHAKEYWAWNLTYLLIVLEAGGY